MTAREWLAKRAELEAAATPGPWHVTRLVDFGNKPSWIVEDVARFRGHLLNTLDLGEDEPTADWLADARTSAPAMRKALEAVLELHHRRPWEVFKDSMYFGQTEFPDQCDHCRLAYPCMTVAAITAALEPTP